MKRSALILLAALGTSIVLTAGMGFNDGLVLLFPSAIGMELYLKAFFLKGRIASVRFQHSQFYTETVMRSYHEENAH